MRERESECERERERERGESGKSHVIDPELALAAITILSQQLDVVGFSYGIDVADGYPTTFRHAV